MLISRAYLAQLVNQATQFNRKIIGIDYVLNAPQPQEDKVLEAALNRAKSSGTLFIFATSRGTKPGYQLWASSQFTSHQTWQGDIRLWRNGRFMTLLPLFKEERPLSIEYRPFPLSYLLALAKVSSESRNNVFKQKKPTELTDKLFKTWMKPLGITQTGYSFRQYWLHPITDFSIPTQSVYKIISAKEFLATPPIQLQKKYSQSVILIIPGGYRTAGVNRFGEDNLPAPPAFCYWQKISRSQESCPLFFGGKVHAYLFHHFLQQKPIIYVTDLWLIWLLFPLSKGLKIIF